MSPRITEFEIMAFNADFQKDVSTFNQQLPRLLEQHPGEFVAILSGEIIAHSKDRCELSGSMRKKYPERYVFVKQIAPKSETVERMDGLEIV